MILWDWGNVHAPPLPPAPAEILVGLLVPASLVSLIEAPPVVLLHRAPWGKSAWWCPDR